ncbi:MAG: hypothetical protein NWS60_04315 [Ilumatobacteraceae bacterium]|nr:hypothetical protein [Ilumatobacteraceae bacterium]MDP4851195.1 hypothetical protein [Ilumatobacteraceae bacterium]
MHDIADLETRGVPAMFIASDVFVQAAESQASALGFPTVQRVFVPHPIQDRTDDEMRALADSAYDSIVAAITIAK